MLDARVNRRPVSRTAGIIMLCALITATAPIASYGRAQTAFATLSGSIVDPMKAAMPGVTVVLINTQNGTKYEVRSDPSGRYEFVGLPPGEYSLKAQLPGFATFESTETMAGQNVERQVSMEVGTVQETISVGTDPAPDRDLTRGSSRRAAPDARQTIECTNRPNVGGTPIGGNIRPPRKLRDVRPVYPAHLRDAGIGGTVQLEARIAPDGRVIDVKVVSSPHDELARAATDAVEQWEFDSTLLNCVRIETRMDVTLTFGKN